MNPTHKDLDAHYVRNDGLDDFRATVIRSHELLWQFEHGETDAPESLSLQEVDRRVETLISQLEQQQLDSYQDWLESDDYELSELQEDFDNYEEDGPPDCEETGEWDAWANDNDIE